MDGKQCTRAALAGALMLAAAVVWAKLPAPAEAELQAKKTAAEKKAKDEEAAKKALARAQDRVAARYKARKRN